MGTSNIYQNLRPLDILFSDYKKKTPLWEKQTNEALVSELQETHPNHHQNETSSSISSEKMYLYTT